LPALNRLLVLKELGLSLEQIARAIETGIGPAEIRGMLRLRLAESEQAIALEQQRLVRIRARLKRLERDAQTPTCSPC
jgi:DNA-binding transcriptional MerR regulator